MNVFKLDVQNDFTKTKEECEREALEKKVMELEILVHKLRKALFGQGGQFLKYHIDHDERIAIIERGLCVKK